MRFQEHLISFRFKGLPKDIHFSISLHPNSTKVNLHVTRNTTDAHSKPKISIVEIDKSILDQLGDHLSKRLFGLMLKPFDMRQFKLDNRNKVWFISYEDIEKGKYSHQMQAGLQNALLPITTFPRKCKLKIDGDIGGQLESLSASSTYTKQLRSYIKHINRVPDVLLISGIVITKKEVKICQRINDRWFEFKQPDDLRKMFAAVLGENNAKALYRRLRRAIVLIRKANSYQEVEKYDKPPILLFKKRAHEKV